MKCYTWENNKQCEREAVYWLYSPDGKRCPGGWSCKEHADVVIREYREKLNEEWYGIEIDEWGNPLTLTPIYRAE